MSKFLIGLVLGVMVATAAAQTVGTPGGANILSIISSDAIYTVLRATDAARKIHELHTDADGNILARCVQ